MLSAADKNKIIELAKAGLTYAELGRRFGIPATTVQYICRVHCAPRKPRLTDDDVERIIELASRGLCVEHICREVGRSFCAVKRALAIHSVSAANQNDVFGSDARSMAVEMVRHGASLGEAAKALGMTRSAVAGACYRAGVKKPEPVREMEDA